MPGIASPIRLGAGVIGFTKALAKEESARCAG